MTWFEGQNDRIQVSVKYSEPGGTANRDVWSVSTEMPEDLDSITLVCRYISKTKLIHSEEELSFKPEKRHLYKGFGELSRDGKQCKARIFDETLGKVISE